MTDDLVKRWDDYVESMGSVMGEVEHMAQQMRDRIEALTAERDHAKKMVAEADTRLGQALGEAIQDKADNARLLKALTNAGSHLERGLDKMAFNIIRAALNAGKEPSNE
jgi:hypothetical protein